MLERQKEILRLMMMEIEESHSGEGTGKLFQDALDAVQPVDNSATLAHEIMALQKLFHNALQINAIREFKKKHPEKIHEFMENLGINGEVKEWILGKEVKDEHTSPVQPEQTETP